MNTRQRRDTGKPKTTPPREVEVPHPSYQPNARELKDDLRLEGIFKDAIKALVKPAKIRKFMPKKGSK